MPYCALELHYGRCCLPQVSFDIYKHQTLGYSVCISWELPYFNVDNKADIYLLLSKLQPFK